MNTETKLVLLIDDDDDDNFFHRRALDSSRLSCRIDVCTSGDVAMDYLSNQGEYASRGTNYPKPDLIFLDINMPRVNGWEFINLYKKRLEESTQEPSTVIVMLSTSGQVSDLERAKSTPLIRQYVEKPLSADVINEIVDRFL